MEEIDVDVEIEEQIPCEIVYFSELFSYTTLQIFSDKSTFFLEDS